MCLWIVAVEQSEKLLNWSRGACVIQVTRFYDLAIFYFVSFQKHKLIELIWFTAQPYVVFDMLYCYKLCVCIVQLVGLWQSWPLTSWVASLNTPLPWVFNHNYLWLQKQEASEDGQEKSSVDISKSLQWITELKQQTLLYFMDGIKISWHYQY